MPQTLKIVQTSATSLEIATFTLERSAAEILQRGGVPQGGVSIAYDPHTQQYCAAQSFLIIE
jgi:hypothetical protein